MAVKLARNNISGVLKIYDGDTPENEIELQFDNGSLNITPGGEETHLRYDRGDIHGAVKGKDIPSDISFEADFVELYKEAADVDPSLFEVLHQVGGAAAFVSRIPGNKYGVKVEWTITNPDATGEDETISFDLCFVEPSGSSIVENEDTDKISFKLKSLDNMPTVVRA